MLKRRWICIKLKKYASYLEYRQLTHRTILRYIKDILQLLEYTNWSISLDSLQNYKRFLQKKYKISSCNTKIISINLFLKFIGKQEAKLKLFRRSRFSCNENTITKEQFIKMRDYCKIHDKEMYYLIYTFAYTGIRASELRMITVESVVNRCVRVFNKQKERCVIIPDNLQKLLIDYINEFGVESGLLFHGRNKDKVIDNSTVNKRLKTIACKCGLPKTIAHPHSFRHLFAKMYMETIGDCFELQELLGHSSINTTMQYARNSFEERTKKLNEICIV